MAMPNPKQTFAYQNQSGIGIMTVLISIAILGVVIAGIMRGVTNSMNAQKTFEEIADMVEVRRVFRARLDCAKTKEANGGSWSSCNSSTNIIGSDVSGNAIINASGSPFSVYRVSLRCAMSGVNASMILRVEKDNVLRSHNVFSTIPLTCT